MFQVVLVGSNTQRFCSSKHLRDHGEQTQSTEDVSNADSACGLEKAMQ